MCASDSSESGINVILYNALLNINEAVFLLDYKRGKSSV